MSLKTLLEKWKNRPSSALGWGERVKWDKDFEGELEGLEQKLHEQLTESSKKLEEEINDFGGSLLSSAPRAHIFDVGEVSGQKKLLEKLLEGSQK